MREGGKILTQEVKKQVIKLFETLLSEYLKATFEDVSISMYKRKIDLLGIDKPLVKNLNIDDNGECLIKVEGDIEEIISTFSETFDALVDVSSFTLGPQEALDNAKAIAVKVLEGFGELPEDVGIEGRILKGSLAKKIAVGVEGFERLIPGGLPRKASVLLQGPPGKEKNMFCEHFIREGLENGGSVLVTLSNVSPEMFRTNMRTMGINVRKYEKRGLLKIVDWYSRTDETIVGIEEDGAVIKSSKDLTNVSVAINKAINELKSGTTRRAVIDVLSPALNIYGADMVYDFARSTRTRLKNNDFTALFVIDRNSHDKRILSSLQQATDGIIDIEKKGRGEKTVRKIGIISMRGTSFESKYGFLHTNRRGLQILEKEIDSDAVIKEFVKIPNVGQTRAKALFESGFTSYDELESASLNELASVPWIGRKLAKEIRNHLFTRDLEDGMERIEEKIERIAAPDIKMFKLEGESCPKCGAVIDPLTEACEICSGKAKEEVKYGEPSELLTSERTLEKETELPDLIFCSNCGAVNLDDSELCWYCEKEARKPSEEPIELEESIEPLEEPVKEELLPTGAMECPGCGAVNPDNLSLCWKCEKELKELKELKEPEGLLEEPVKDDDENKLHESIEKLEEEIAEMEKEFETDVLLEIVCPVCGKSNSSDTTICSSCGLELATDDEFYKDGAKSLSKGLTNGLIGMDRRITKRGRINGRTNGLVNGKARINGEGRINGLINGRGRINGLVNGLTNGMRALRPGGGRINGLVNGLGRINGRINGEGRINGLISGRGRINGLVNGLTNGMRALRFGDGRINGLVNGLVNGKGRINGEGRINGLINGEGRINGLVNGLTNGRSALSMEVKRIGFTNGNGLVNGLRTRRYYREARTDRWKWLVIPLVAVILFVSPILLTEKQTQAGISVDGEFEDWQEAVITPCSVSKPGFNPNVDIMSVGVEEDEAYCYFYLSVEGGVLKGGADYGDRTVDTFHIFVDSDQDHSTGYLIHGIGADYLFSIYGYDQEILSSHEFTFDNNKGQSDWNGWIEKGNFNAKILGSQLEAIVSWKNLGIQEQGRKIDVYFNAKGFDGDEDFSDTVISNSKGVLFVTQQSVLEPVTGGPDNTANTASENGINGIYRKMIRLDLEALDRTMRVEELEVKLKGNAAVNSVKLIREDGSTIAESSPANRKVKFAFSEPIPIEKGDKLSLYVSGDMSPVDAGRTIGAEITHPHDITVENGTVSLNSLSPDLGFADLAYVKDIPKKIEIDGAFSDWQPWSNEFNKDAARDVREQNNENIDALDFGVVRGSKINFYLNVEGEMLGGVEVPYKNTKAPDKKSKGEEGIITTPKDTDRDGIPDDNDTFPHDFNNDGIEDAETNDDCDGDGITDYPRGNDYWLNNTATGASVYIGPPQLPPLNGEDKVFIFLDTNDIPYSGYSVGDIFADWMIEVKGKYGEILSSEYYYFNGSSSKDWPWIPVGDAKAECDSHQLEVQVGYLDIGVDENDDFKVYYYTSDWQGNTDHLDQEFLTIRYMSQNTSQNQSGTNWNGTREALTGPYEQVPEFPSMILPACTVLMIYWICRFKGNKKVLSGKKGIDGSKGKKDKYLHDYRLKNMGTEKIGYEREKYEENK